MKQVALPNGVRLAYEMLGDAAAPKRAVLVHSLAMDHTFWRPVAERLAREAAVLIYDCRGHGTSDKRPGPYTVELFAADLAALLDAVGWRTALVAGASMGGGVTLAFAAAHPQRVTALGLVDTTAWYGAEAPQQWAERAARALKSGLGAMVDFQVTRWFSDAFRAQHPDVVRQAVDVFLRNDLPVYAASCRMLGACDLRAALPTIAAPTAILVGEEDYATPLAMADALRRDIRGASLTVLKGARHLTPLERPDQVAAALAPLL
ncbi:MAG: alpha/beta fold hydrolase [Alphaproteobacteria bacterium]|nr:alpha/beta fold hydrolase [Alphaproteobacteria bacterium]